MALRSRSLYLPEDMRRSRSVLRQDQNNRFCGIDRMNDLACIVRPRCYIPGRDPALETLTFQSRCDIIGDGRVGRGVADEYVTCAGPSASCLLFAATFTHGASLVICWQMRPVFIKVAADIPPSGPSGRL